MKFKFKPHTRKKNTAVRLINVTSPIAIVSAMVMFVINMGKAKVAFALNCQGDGKKIHAACIIKK